MEGGHCVISSLSGIHAREQYSLEVPEMIRQVSEKQGPDARSLKAAITCIARPSDFWATSLPIDDIS
jgi:hypothetical protein